MKWILWAVFFLILTFTNVGSADTIQTWLGTGLSPLTTSQYPERDTIRFKQISSNFPTVIPPVGAGLYRYHVVNVGNNKLACLTGNTVYDSHDAVTWVARSSSLPFSTLEGMEFYYTGGKIWTISGKIVYHSEDAITWNVATTTAPWAVSSYYGITSFNDELYVITGTKSVYKSSDGVNWTCLTTDAPFVAEPARLVTKDNKLYYISYWNVSNHAVWTSVDGINWTNIGNAGAISYGGMLVKLITYGNYLIMSSTYYYRAYSTDGIVWSGLPQGAVAFCVYRGHIIVVSSDAKYVYRSY